MVDSVLKSETKSTNLLFAIAVPNAYVTNKFLIIYDALYYVEYLALFRHAEVYIQSVKAIEIRLS